MDYPYSRLCRYGARFGAKCVALVCWKIIPLVVVPLADYATMDLCSCASLVGLFYKVCSTTPAHAGRFDHLAGSLDIGRRGNFLLLNANGDVCNGFRRDTDTKANAVVAGGGGGGGTGKDKTSGQASDPTNTGCVYRDVELEQVWIGGRCYFVRQRSI